VVIGFNRHFIGGAAGFRFRPDVAGKLLLRRYWPAQFCQARILAYCRIAHNVEPGLAVAGHLQPFGYGVEARL
jgi:hypothetical protein